MSKEIFRKYLEKHLPQKADELMISFERFLEALWEENSKVNLISRKTAQKYICWILHIKRSMQ